MGAARMLSHWTRSVRQSAPDLHGHQVKTLALMALSMCRAGTCQVTRMVLSAPVFAKLSSTRRRFERFVANDRLDHVHTAMALAASFTWRWSGRTARVLIDETALGPWMRCMKVSVACRGRAMPLVWTCYREDDPPASQPEIVELLLDLARQCLPPDTRVVLMADRGLSWPLLIDRCHALGWDYLLRVQGQTAVLLPDESRCSIGSLAPRPGRRWCGAAKVFRKAGWRDCQVVAAWKAKRSEPWLLITSLPPRLKRCEDYRIRMWQEQSFRDEKSHGFQWGQSRVRHPEHAERLLLAMQLAMWMTMLLGAELDRRGWRDRVESTSRPTLSLFQLGYRAWPNDALATLIRGPTSTGLTPED